MAVLLESRAPSAARVSRPAVLDPEEALAQATAEVLEGPPVAAPPGAVSPAAARPEKRRRRWHRPAFSPAIARLTALVMIVGFVAATAVEPAANGTRPVLPFWADALANATLVVLLGCWAALAVGRRSGLWLGAAAGGGLIAMTVACPAVDHHAIAGWWWAQLAVSIGIVAMSVGLLAGTRSGRADAAAAARRRLR
jgi:hypothetical protein